ncbi:hypothetical protein C8F01DRAFT_652354 [Mycena amicta]|nr:hypothetical protein C8F01DRAFT_652354 [Mycena amicta]
MSSRRHLLRQLQLIVPGTVATYYLHTLHHLRETLSDAQSWARTATLASLALGGVTIALFVYIILAPWLHGVQPDFRSWRASGVLSNVIPLLTFCIVTGWLGITITLGQWTSMGYLRGAVAGELFGPGSRGLMAPFTASAVYATTFGCLGLIPAQSIRQREQQRPD